MSVFPAEDQGAVFRIALALEKMPDWLCSS